jgi:hypothetical protein
MFICVKLLIAPDLTQVGIRQRPAKRSRMRKAVIPAIVFAVATPMFFLSNVSQAHAATTCYAGSCTGQYAGNTTCASDAEVIETQTFGGAGSLQLKYSPSCRATWARVIGIYGAYGGENAAGAVIKSTSSSVGLKGCESSGAVGSGCNTPMIDDLAPLTSYAEGSVPNYNGHLSIYATTSPPF